MSNRGYVLIRRGFFKHPRLAPKGPFSNAEAMLWLIDAASFAPRDVVVMVGTTRRTVHLEPGQMTHSIRFLAQAWRWSPNRVQRFLGDLAADCSVATQTDTAKTIITLCNWDKYQNPFSQANTQTDTATNTQTDTKKKELKERKICSPRKASKSGTASTRERSNRVMQGGLSTRSFAMVSLATRCLWKERGRLLRAGVPGPLKSGSSFPIQPPG